jgi:hypothetical protein
MSQERVRKRREGEYKGDIEMGRHVHTPFDESSRAMHHTGMDDRGGNLDSSPLDHPVFRKGVQMDVAGLVLKEDATTHVVARGFPP